MQCWGVLGWGKTQRPLHGVVWMSWKSFGSIALMELWGDCVEQARKAGQVARGVLPSWCVIPSPSPLTKHDLCICELLGIKKETLLEVEKTKMEKIINILYVVSSLIALYQLRNSYTRLLICYSIRVFFPFSIFLNIWLQPIMEKLTCKNPLCASKLVP